MKYYTEMRVMGANGAVCVLFVFKFKGDQLCSHEVLCSANHSIKHVQRQPCHHRYPYRNKTIFQPVALRSFLLISWKETHRITGLATNPLAVDLRIVKVSKISVDRQSQ